MSSAAMIEQAAAWSLRGVRCPGGVVASSVMTDDRLLPVLLTARTPTSPHLSRLVWLGEQLGLLADELVGLLHHDDVLNNLVAAEFDALRHGRFLSPRRWRRCRPGRLGRAPPSRAVEPAHHDDLRLSPGGALGRRMRCDVTV